MSKLHTNFKSGAAILRVRADVMIACLLTVPNSYYTHYIIDMSKDFLPLETDSVCIPTKIGTELLLSAMSFSGISGICQS